MSDQLDAEQLKLDLEDANARLDRLHKAMAKKDNAEAEVKRLTTELAQAKRRLKEAGWEVTLLLAKERTKGGKG